MNTHDLVLAAVEALGELANAEMVHGSVREMGCSYIVSAQKVSASLRQPSDRRLAFLRRVRWLSTLSCWQRVSMTEMPWHAVDASSLAKSVASICAICACAKSH